MDLRREINEQIRAGRSDRDIVDFMVARYGDFVLYRPPVKPHTWLLWLGPALLAVAALIAFVRALRNRRRRAVERPLTEPSTRGRAIWAVRSDRIHRHRRAMVTVALAGCYGRCCGRAPHAVEHSAAT